MDKFWMVYVSGKGSPTRTHATPEEAEQEAERLAGLPGNRGLCAVVLEAMSYCKVLTPVQWHTIK